MKWILSILNEMSGFKVDASNGTSNDAELNKNIRPLDLFRFVLII